MHNITITVHNITIRINTLQNKTEVAVVTQNNDPIYHK